jgi:hypothetical protein
VALKEKREMKGRGKIAAQKKRQWLALGGFVRG